MISMTNQQWRIPQRKAVVAMAKPELQQQLQDALTCQIVHFAYHATDLYVLLIFLASESGWV